MPSEKDVLYYELTENTPQKIIHGKYPWLMHLIRYQVGYEKFIKALKLIFNKFRFRTFTFEEFIAVIEEGCGQTLQWWREEWLERKGVPEIAFESETQNINNKYIIKCIFKQVDQLYHLPVEIAIESANGKEIKKVDIAEKE